MMSWGGLQIALLVLGGVISLVFGLTIVLQKLRDMTAWLFFGVTLGVGLWSLGIAAFIGLTQPAPALGFVQLYYIAAAFIVTMMYLVAITLRAKQPPAVLHGVAAMLPFVALSSLLILFPQFMIASLEVTATKSSVVLAPSGYALYVGYFFVYFFLAVAVFWHRAQAKVSHNRMVRLQMRGLLRAYMTAGGIGALFNLILPGLGNYQLIWVGPLAVFVFIPFIYVSIVRYGLFDMRHALVRTLSYVMSLGALTVVYYSIMYVASLVLVQYGFGGAFNVGPANIALAIVIALLFQPVKHFFDKLTAQLFYRNEYQREALYTELGRILAYNTDMAHMLERAATYLSDSIKVDGVTFYVKGYGFFSSQQETVKRLPAGDVSIIEAHRKTLHIEQAVEVNSLSTQALLRKILMHYGVHVFMPLLLDDKPVGYVFLGEHKSRGYTKRDLGILNSIASELVIAIQNSLSVEKVRQLNDTLKQRVDDATRELRRSNEQLQRLDKTKDEFIGMASHQLRTPLTSIKGYIDMVLDGDVGPVNDMQRQMLSEAFMSSERMVSLINDFLNVSRLQTGRFMIDRRPYDLATMVTDEVRTLSVLAQQQGVKVTVRVDKTIPELKVDGEKLRQVVINMIDNAIYYSHGKKSVQVSLKKVGKTIEFRVRDHGIGVPASEQSGLFGKFFRASNAKRRRPDGTGVGLFLARKVILAHGGEIIFESTEGKGSTFGFILPLE